MATYSTLRSGSSGSDVKKLQNALIKAGYSVGSTGADGIYGSNTAAAVKKYQKANGLSVDGIAGNETLSSLYGSSSSKNTTKTTAKNNTNATTNKFKASNALNETYNKKTKAENAVANYSDFKASNALNEAYNKKTESEDAVANYGDFSYSNQEAYDKIIDQILNRKDFSYDLNGDALYQQYKDKYIQHGKMAMMDTMGQASALTGGYGNSYASTAGNQAYQASLQNLNDIVPELYQMAYDRYNQEGQDLINQYGVLSDERSTQYGEWGDKYNQLVANRDYYGTDYYNKYSQEYGKYTDDYNKLVDLANLYGTNYNNAYSQEYGEYRDKVSDEQWQKTFDEGVRQYNASLEENKRQYNETMAYNKSQTSSSSGSSSSGSSGGSSSGGSSNGGNNNNEPDESIYADWDGLDWESYFAQIRQNEGQSAAEEELDYFVENELIPQNMITFGASGARGGRLGH